MKISSYKSSFMKFITATFTVFVIVGIYAHANCQENQNNYVAGIGLEFGHWIPTQLIDQHQLTSLNAIDESPYWGIVLFKNWRSMAFRINSGYWHYYEKEANKQIKIGSLAADMKFSILSDIWFMPYVVYGLGWFLGNEVAEDSPAFHFLNDPEIGVGFNIGAGFDFIIRNINIAIEFKYHYVNFNHSIGSTTNYSGPKISLQAIYLFNY